MFHVNSSGRVTNSTALIFVSKTATVNQASSPWNEVNSLHLGQNLKSRLENTWQKRHKNGKMLKEMYDPDFFWNKNCLGLVKDELLPIMLFDCLTERHVFFVYGFCPEVWQFERGWNHCWMVFFRADLKPNVDLWVSGGISPWTWSFEENYTMQVSLLRRICSFRHSVILSMFRGCPITSSA